MGDSTSLPLLAFLWQPLALPGCHITPLLSAACRLPSLTLSLSLSSAFLLPLSVCLVSCVWQWCHYRAARITLPPMSCLSVCPHSVSRSPLSFSLSILWLVSCPWRLYVTFIPKTLCPSQTLPIIPCKAAA